MWPFSPTFRSVQKEAIDRIDELIIKLKDKKKEWKRFRPDYEPDMTLHVGFVGEVYPSEEEIKFCLYVQHVMKHVRKVCIKLCSDYISFLKMARKAIKKKEGERLKAALNEILNIMIGVFNHILLSDWKKELRKVHKLEFKAELNRKKWQKEKGRRLAKWDVEFMKKHKPLADIVELGEGNPSSIQGFREFGSEMVNQKGWRNYSFLRNDLKKELDFQKFLEWIIKGYKKIIGSI